MTARWSIPIAITSRRASASPTASMPKTVFRGGYGISYIHQNRVGSADLLGINCPQVVIATINQSNPLDPTFRTTQQGYPAGITDAMNFSVANANITYIPKNFRRLTCRVGSSPCSAS